MRFEVGDLVCHKKTGIEGIVTHVNLDTSFAFRGAGGFLLQNQEQRYFELVFRRADRPRPIRRPRPSPAAPTNGQSTSAPALELDLGPLDQRELTPEFYAIKPMVHVL